jgi:hypothetical protein
MAAAQRQQDAGRRLIVHLGVQKTGSTAIQRHLQRNAAALADTLVIRTPQQGTPMRPLGRAAVAFSLNNHADSRTALRIALKDVLETLPANDLPVLLSHENLAGAMPGNGGETRLYPALPEIARLIVETAKGFSTDFVIYTRELADWRRSVWAQAIRSDGYDRDYADFAADTATITGWDNLHARMAAAVGAERVCLYRIEDETSPERPGRQLLRHAGLAERRIDALSPLENPRPPRLSAASLEFLRHLNGLALNPHARGKVADLVDRTQHLFTAETPSEGTL